MKPKIDAHTGSSPFLRWAGGKKWFVKHLEELSPTKFNNYHEIFLGGGSVFFSMNCTKKSHLADLNKDLIETYIQVRDNVEGVIAQLKKFKNTKEDYYKIRSKIYTNEYMRAAQFIYLNMTSFNGIYRVNRDGVYNVPYGSRFTIDFIQENVLRNASQKLENTNLKSWDFADSLKKVKKGDFVFIDPPYTVEMCIRDRYKKPLKEL